MSDKLAALIGGAIGIALVLYGIVYLPMKASYGRCGRVTLCDQVQP